jgi:hypothetical protein
MQPDGDRGRAQANRMAEARRRDEQAYHDRIREQHRQARRDYHIRQAETVLQTARELAARHLVAARALQDELERS